MSESKHTRDSGSLDISDDRARAVDEAGRRAGAALRSSAPEHGADAIQGRARRRTVVRATALTAAVGVLVVAGVIAFNTDDRSGEEQPVDTVPTTNRPAPPQRLNAVELGTLEGDQARYSAGGSLLIGQDQRVDIYDATLTRAGELPCPTRLETLPDSLGTAPSADWVWDVEAASQWDGEAISDLRSVDWPRLCGVMVNADGSRALTSADVAGDAPPDGGERRQLLWDTSDGSLVAVIAGVWPAFSADGSKLLTGDTTSLTLRDSSTGAIVTSISDDRSGTGFGNAAVSRDGSRVLWWVTTAEGELMGDAIVYDLQTLTPIATLSTTSQPNVLGQNEAQFDTAGRLFTLDAGGVTIWDASTGAALQHVPIQLALNNNSLAITPDGDMLAVSHGDRITIFDSSNGTKLADVGLRENEHGAATFSPDGLSLAAHLSRGFPNEEPVGIRIWRLDPLGP